MLGFVDYCLKNLANITKYDRIGKNNSAQLRRKEDIMIPKDPVMLLSFVNLKLRDFYQSLDAMCEDMDLDKKELEQKLAGIDYHYNKERNQFV